MSNRDFDEKDLMKDVDELYKVNGDSSADQHENMPGAESESIAERAEQNEKGKAKRKPRKVVFTTKQVILAVVISVIAVLAIGATIIFTAIDVNPISYIAGEITQNKLVNKWQSQSAPGLTAYEFYDDGTYTSYLSTYTFDGEYEVNGDK